MVLEKNPDYFLPGVPGVDRAVLRIIPEYTTAVAGLESGALDIVYDLPPEMVDQLKKSTVSRVEEVPTGTWQGIIFNNEFKPFGDARVREALTAIVDREAMCDIATFGHGTPTVTPIPPTHPYFRKDLLVPPDVPGAKQLLAAAGLGDGASLEMFVPGAMPALERLATAYRDAAKQVGLKISLTVIPQDKFFAEMEGKVPFNVDEFFGRTTPDLMLYAWYHYRRIVEQHAVALQQSRRWTSCSTRPAAPSTRPSRRSCTAGSRKSSPRTDPAASCYVQNFACGVSKKVANFVGSSLMYVNISQR